MEATLYIQITHGRSADDKTSTLIRHKRDEGRATSTACNLSMFANARDRLEGRYAILDVPEAHHYVTVSVPCSTCFA